ncbi:MAG TPA: uracil-DNA glycosylase family protein [Alphaproteobacteria bacterium]|nr:uracil-DNA glycosylase family protein [Alphaproteobacteria bacterium]
MSAITAARRGSVRAPSRLQGLLTEIRACRVCAACLPCEPRPIVRASATACLVICSQAPGTRVHETGLSFNDASGDRLRAWLGMTRETFYDERRVAIIGMGFCYPGQDENGGDLPPRKECAPLWQTRLFAELPQVELKLLVGSYALAWHLKGRTKANMTETVRAWREYLPEFIPLPHPSWRNNAWIKQNPWFEAELLPELRARVHALL